MRMEQRLTPQLIQSMAILQKPVADLEAYIASALEGNAALEVEEPAAPSSEDDGQGNRQRTDDRDAPGFARLDRFSRYYDMDGNERAPHSARRVTSDNGRDAKMGAMANTAGGGNYACLGTPRPTG